MFDSICEKLFGAGKENQEKLLIKLLLMSIAVIVIAVITDFQGAYAFMFIVWGWRVLYVCRTIPLISQFFEYNIVVSIIAFLICLTIGMFAGVGISIIGLIRFVQLMVERYMKK